MKYFLIFLLTIQLVFASPRKQLDIQLKHDFGTVKAGEEVNITFKGKNTGESTVEITKIRVSCTCTKTTITKLTIPAKSEFEIPVIFKSKGQKGRIHKIVSLTIKGEKYPLPLRLFGTVEASKSLVVGRPTGEPVLQKTCPFKPLPIDKSKYVDFEGKRIYTCCDECLPLVKANPVLSTAGLSQE